jgi:hypothetical protein
VLATFEVPEADSAPRDESRRNVVFGHAAFDFLASRAGADGPRRFFTALRANPSAGPLNAYLTAIGLPAADFDRHFGVYLKGPAK